VIEDAALARCEAALREHGLIIEISLPTDAKGAVRRDHVRHAERAARSPDEAKRNPGTNVTPSGISLRAIRAALVVFFSSWPEPRPGMTKKRNR
jgi:hypothetical protein